jgi:uncharacterized protein
VRTAERAVRAAALSQFVLKVHSRCDLACDHCYIYQAADDTWRDRPTVMADATVVATGRRIAEYAAAHGLDRVEVVLHGGEPLLAGHAGLRRICELLAAELSGVCAVGYSMQTNAVRLDREFCQLLREFDVQVGVSLDGGRAANDRHRRYAHGGGSYDQVVRSLELLRSPEFRGIYGGLLCTVDVTNDPVRVFEDLAAMQPLKIDFLLPHATWDSPPPGAVPGETRHGDWLCAVFDHWYDAPPAVSVRLFEELINALLGGASRSEAIGLSAAAFAVVETDGAIEQTDALKIAFRGAPATGYSVFDGTFDDVAAHPAIAGRLAGSEGLCETCRECPLVSACGGGLYAHRHRRGSGWANPSVYCDDLVRLITHVQGRLARDLSRLESRIP